MRQFLENMQALGIYPILAFFIFFTFFLLAVISALTTDRETIQTEKNLPFLGEEPVQPSTDSQS